MGIIKLNKKNLFHNLEYFANLCGSKSKLCIALKDNAYGHGLEQTASMLREFEIDHVFVRTMQEAYEAQKFSFKSILVLYDIPKTFHEQFIVSINSLDHIEKIPQNSKVELKIDTGMNRNGITLEEIPKALEKIRENSLELFGVFTHFCCADEDDTVTKQQETRFLQAVNRIKELHKNPFRIHCANSAGVHKVDMSQYDLARVGIGAYGYLDLEEEKYLHPVLSLWAKKITSKTLLKGDHVGYGPNAFIASQNMTVSNYDIGYGDGFLRLSEHKKAKTAEGLEILGRVSMDSFSVSSSSAEICVFDNVTNLAKTHQTIKYEILTSLKSHIERIIV